MNRRSLLSGLARFLAKAMVVLLLVPAPGALAATAKGPIVYSVLETDSPLEPGEYLWEPQRGRPGRLEIVADLARDTLYVYRGGVEIGRTILIYGADHKPTPLGSFPILQKRERHISNLYGAPMPYMMRLTWGGISIHGSGEVVENRWATHGCIGLPDEFAALLFKVARVGDRVTVTRNWLPQAYS